MNSLSTLFFPNDSKKYHIKSLDGLRGLAVLLVLLSHSSLLGLKFLPFLSFEYTGTYGVYLFFVLSAYLLDKQICRAFVDGNSGTKFWINYFLRRFLRIYPLFFVAVIFNYFLFVSEYSIYSIPISKEDIPPHLLMVYGKHIFWSIPVEFKYYFLSPLIVFVAYKYLNFDNGKTLIFFIGLVFLSLALSYLRVLGYFGTVSYFPIFLAGTFLAIIETNSNVMQAVRKWIDFLTIISLLIIVLTSKVIWKDLLHFEQFPFHGLKFYTLYGVCWGFLLAKVLNGGRNFITILFEFKALRFLGNISFSAYLWHIPVLYFTTKSGFFDPGYGVYLFFTGTILISSISYFVIEYPLSKVKLRYNQSTK
ncbi:acyltransferase [Fulvivirga sp. M361]|uniref:acyltransferase family protein n=1 Tax=Fulvivirga sp. M361 TaxID=2594266 RepID=UPI00117B425D|nr:acyltransferase [Fulvivirga sp. M361]TRX50216.1 acyltransferase [Fulvivirga sp. M361]